MEVNYLDIAQHLSLRKEDVLLITGNVTRLALQEKDRNSRFDAARFINRFKQQLPEGSLLFHAFSDHLLSGDTFYYTKTKPTTGALSVAAWKDPEFVRSHDPFHSFMIWGKEADALQRLEHRSTFGPDSVFGRLHRCNAKMLFIDVPLIQSFTFVHYCEEALSVPYRKHREHTLFYVDEKGERSTVKKLFYTRRSGYYTSLDRLEERLAEEGVTTVYDFNGIPFKLMNLAGAYDFIARNILEQHASLLHGFSYKQFATDVLRKLYRTFRPRKRIS
jgi:aminoglycoside 3-N-acetyltransferase